VERGQGSGDLWTGLPVASFEEGRRLGGRRNDPERFERTKALILEIYDAMGSAEESGGPYKSLLDPPPGQGPRHPER